MQIPALPDWARGAVSILVLTHSHGLVPVTVLRPIALLESQKNALCGVYSLARGDTM